MFLTKLPDFRKSEDCPSSHELLEFQNGDRQGRFGPVCDHLNTCEFCAAEVEFYSHYPQEETAPEIAAIPAPLFELADALLRNRHSDSRSLDALLARKPQFGC